MRRILFIIILGMCAMWSMAQNDTEALEAAGFNVVDTRANLRTHIKEWGECKTVAITQMNGDVAVYGDNAAAFNHLPQRMTDAIVYLNGRPEELIELHLTEMGRWVVLFGWNGIFRAGLPKSLDEQLLTWNEEIDDTITGAFFNDHGDWIAITNTQYAASSDEIKTWLDKGVQQYGRLLSACVTDDARVAVFENGVLLHGNVPEDLQEHLDKITWKIHHVKIAGPAWFISDRSGSHCTHKLSVGKIDLNALNEADKNEKPAPRGGYRSRK